MVTTRRSAGTSESAIKTRIITHMNADHRGHLSMYLQYYLSIPRAVADTAELTDVSVSSLSIEVEDKGRKRTVELPIDPPMANLGESRERLAAMAHEATAGLSVGNVNRVALPTWGWITWALVGFGYWCFWTGKSFEPGHWVRKYVLFDYAPLNELLLQYHRWVFGLMVVLHLAEAVYLDQSRLGQHGVKRWTGVWWGWVLITFVEGYGSIKRFEQEVAREKAIAKEAAEKAGDH